MDRQITHGLTDLGQQQAANAAELLAALPIERAVFLTSDYTRARETAAIAAVRPFRRSPSISVLLKRTLFFRLPPLLPFFGMNLENVFFPVG